jgi:hypothetical protein
MAHRVYEIFDGQLNKAQVSLYILQCLWQDSSSLPLWSINVDICQKCLYFKGIAQKCSISAGNSWLQIKLGKIESEASFLNWKTAFYQMTRLPKYVAQINPISFSVYVMRWLWKRI